ncbi:hypothetical protein P692DRAFT_201699469 [Suillus brevipes Sb2]|nr:hypothetical protein P692DRAFT_201699469 [Suillus brevipes Sb2]
MHRYHHSKQDDPCGTFPRTRRDRILFPANQNKFRKISITNNCRVCLRELLVAMVDEELITQMKFDEIIEAGPLQLRQSKR